MEVEECIFEWFMTDRIWQVMDLEIPTSEKWAHSIAELVIFY